MLVAVRYIYRSVRHLPIPVRYDVLIFVSLEKRSVNDLRSKIIVKARI